MDRAGIHAGLPQRQTQGLLPGDPSADALSAPVAGGKRQMAGNFLNDLERMRRSGRYVTDGREPDQPCQLPDFRDVSSGLLRHRHPRQNGNRSTRISQDPPGFKNMNP